MFRTGSIILRRHCRTNSLTQIGFIMLFWLTGEIIVRTTGLRMPGGILGLFILTALLITNLVSVQSVRLGARWFIGEMLLFFVPAVLVILDHRELFGLLGLKIFAVILLSTLTVMTVTAVFVEITHRFMAKRIK